MFNWEFYLVKSFKVRDDDQSFSTFEFVLIVYKSSEPIKEKKDFLGVVLLLMDPKLYLGLTF